MTKARFIRKGNSRVKRLNTTGRARVVGVRNTTDRNRPKGSRRVRGYVNNPDTGKKSGIARKNHRRRT